MLCEGRSVNANGFFENRPQRPKTFLLSGRAVFRQGDTDFVSECLHRLRKRQPIMGHQESDGIPMGVTAKAVINLFVGTDRERRALFLMKGAAGPEIPAFFLQRYAAIDETHQITVLQQGVNECGRKVGHGSA
ncbi:hypothetical protein GGI1_09343 [Acidithiobacillus sp. GGI-221]|nr:hypothetical protein GGI1_09343 [Acidithiobacillus sp. GGI-221]